MQEAAKRSKGCEILSLTIMKDVIDVVVIFAKTMEISEMVMLEHLLGSSSRYFDFLIETSKGSEKEKGREGAGERERENDFFVLVFLNRPSISFILTMMALIIYQLIEMLEISDRQPLSLPEASRSSFAISTFVIFHPTYRTIFDQH